MLDTQDLRNYVQQFKDVWDYLGKVGSDDLSYVLEQRMYVDPEMADTLVKAGMVYLPEGTADLDFLRSKRLDLGFFSESGNFFLGGRYLLPIRDIYGNAIAVVGWYPDKKKYLTTSGKYFSKSTYFYGLEGLATRGSGVTFLCEGIFDRLMVESFGYRCVSTMGIDVTAEKRALYNMMGHIVAVPDADKVGRRVISGDQWKLPVNGSYLEWFGTVDLGLESGPMAIKDIDNFGKFLDREYVSGILKLAALKDAPRVVKIYL